jgi:hypothetical protein
MNPTTIPPTTPVTNPLAGGTPEAIAMPIQSGSATKDAIISDDNVGRSRILCKLIMMIFNPEFSLLTPEID